MEIGKPTNDLIYRSMRSIECVRNQLDFVISNSSSGLVWELVWNSVSESVRDSVKIPIWISVNKMTWK